MSEPTGENTTPAKAWKEMRRGNERFVNAEPRHPRQDVERRAELAGTQTPHAALFGCSDSRLAAEIIFDKGLGDLFVIRNAGQVISSSVLGSLEYAVAVLNVPLIVVLGHDSCGAVRAAIDSQAADATPLPAHIDGLVQKIVPAVRRVTGAMDATPIDPQAVDASAVGREHLRDTIAEMLERSEMISDAVAAGTLAIVGANYRLLEGRAVADIAIGAVDLSSDDEADDVPSSATQPNAVAAH
jgi:carbonic anhydrase